MPELTTDQMEKMLNAQADRIGGIMRNSAGSSGGTTASGGGVADKAIAAFVGGVPTVTHAFTQLGTGTLQLKDVFTGVGNSLGMFGGIGGAIGKAGAEVGVALYDMNGHLRESSKNGAYFNNNLGLFNSSVLNAKMTTAEFAKTQEQYGTRLAGLGSNVDKSSLVYLKLAADIQNDPLVYKLQAMGMGIEETNKTLLTTATSRRNMDMMSEKAAKSTIDATIQLAVEMDNTARLTGKSREEQRKQLEETMRRTDIKLSMQLMTPEQKAAFEQANAYVSRMGDTATNVARIYATGGPKNEEDTKAIAAMDPKMRSLIQELVTETDPNRRKGIQQQIDLAALQASQDNSRIEVARGLVASGDATAKQTAEVVSGQMEYGNIMRQLQREYEASKDKDKMSFEKFKEINVERAVAEERKRAGTGTGSEGKAALLSQGINQVERGLKDATSGTAVAFDKLNKSTGDLIDTFVQKYGAMRAVSPKEVAGAPKAAAEAVKEKTGVGKASIPATEKRQDGSLGATGKFIEDWGKESLVKLHGKEGVITEKQFQGLFGDLGKQINGKTTNPNQIQNMFGDLGKLHGKEGVITEKQFQGLFGNLGKLHGKEGVITEKQFQGLFGNLGKQINGSMPNPSQIQDMLGGVTGSLKGDLEKAKQSIPTTDTFEKMFNQMKMPDMGEITKQISGNMPTASAPATGDDAMTEVAKGVNQLNMRIERLISAVEDGTGKNVRALKAGGNMLAP